ncbi:MAG: hypothetical protein AABX29_02845 [Nanoarchaeota archaeon]
MSSVTFKFDKNKDLFNIWETVNSNNSFGTDFKKNLSSRLIEISKGRSFEDCKKELEEAMKKVHDSPIIKLYIKNINSMWEIIEKEYFKRIEKVMKKPIYIKKFTGYLTTAGKCPYNLKENWFMINLFSSDLGALMTTGHELMHLQFHHYYWNNFEKEVGKEKTADLKEALTVLLNLEFKDLWFIEDPGYEKHKDLRNFVSDEWKKEKDFDLLLKKCINYLKKN